MIVSGQACPVWTHTPAFNSVGELCVVILISQPGVLDRELINDDSDVGGSGLGRRRRVFTRWRCQSRAWIGGRKETTQPSREAILPTPVWNTEFTSCTGAEYRVDPLQFPLHLQEIAAVPDQKTIKTHFAHRSVHGV